MIRYLAALWLPAVGLWPALAHAAGEAVPSGMEAVSGPDGQSLRLVPEQLSTLYKINDDDPETYIPTVKDRLANPVEFGYYVQDLLTRAEVEARRKDQARVIKYYRALAAALPEEARGWGLLCEAYQKAGDAERAIRACKYAIDRHGAQLQDFRRTVELLTAKPGDLSPEDREDLTAVLAHLDKQPDLTIPTAHLRCEAGVKMKETAALEACTAVLARTAPDDPKTIVFQWSLAVMRGDRAQAGRLLERAQKAGVAAESIDRMNRFAAAGGSRTIGIALVGALTTLCALLLLAYFRRRPAPTGRLAP